MRSFLKDLSSLASSSNKASRCLADRVLSKCFLLLSINFGTTDLGVDTALAFSSGVNGS